MFSCENKNWQKTHLSYTWLISKAHIHTDLKPMSIGHSPSHKDITFEIYSALSVQFFGNHLHLWWESLWSSWQYFHDYTNELMTEHTLNTFTQTQRPVFFSIYTLQLGKLLGRGTGKLLGKRGNIFPNSENKITLSQFLVKHAFTLELLCSSLFQTGDTQSYPQWLSSLSSFHLPYAIISCLASVCGL